MDWIPVLVRSSLLVMGIAVGFVNAWLYLENRLRLDRLVGALGWGAVVTAQVFLLYPPLDQPAWVRIGALNSGMSLVAASELVRVWPLLRKGSKSVGN